VTEVHLFDPQTLYRHWEDGQWSPFAIDLGADQEQWRELGGEDRGLIFWALSSLAVAAEPALAEAVRAVLRELLPAVAESLTPPDREGTDWNALGAGADEIREFALGGLTRRLNLIGVPLSSL